MSSDEEILDAIKRYYEAKEGGMLDEKYPVVGKLTPKEKINSHILRLAGRAELPQELEANQNYHISLEGSVPKIEMHSNEDGTFNIVIGMCLMTSLDEMKKRAKKIVQVDDIYACGNPRVIHDLTETSKPA